MIQLADGLQRLFEIVIAIDRLTNLRNLLETQAHLASLSAGIAHCEDPERMALATGAFQAPRRVMDGALEQRAAQDTRRGGELGSQLFPLADGL